MVATNDCHHGSSSSSSRALLSPSTTLHGVRVQQLELQRWPEQPVQPPQEPQEPPAQQQQVLPAQQERQPELADIHIVRGRADFTPAMPDFVTAFLEHALPR